MNAIRIKNGIWIALLCLTATGFAESAKSLVSEGNKLYRQQQYKEAGQKYDQAVETDSAAAQAEFNKANSLYRQGDYDAAVEAFQQAAVKSKDSRLTAKAKFNLGNSYFQQGQKLAQTEPNDAINKFEDGIHAWRQAQDLDPSNKNAAQNIEMTRLTIGQIKQMLEQQKQQQAQQQDLQKKLEELKDKQQQLSQDTKKQQVRSEPTGSKPVSKTIRVKQRNPGHPRPDAADGPAADSNHKINSRPIRRTRNCRNAVK